MHQTQVTAIGSYVPPAKLTNDQLQQLVETSDEWIVQRTGIKERRIAGDDQFTSDLCEAAIHNLLERYNQTAEDVDFIIACTHTPDLPFPGVACQLQHRLGVKQAGAIDVNATCAGFVYGLHLAHTLIRSGLHRKILVVAGDTMSKITDYTDRTTCILFGDAAGAAMVERAEENAFLGIHLDSDGSGGGMLYRSGLSGQWQDQLLKQSGKVVQNGREVYKWAVSTIPAGMSKTVQEAKLTFHDVDWFVPHSANLKMLEAICERSGFPLSQTLYSMVHYGNTSAASIPLSIDQALQEGILKPGQHLLLYGFGGGLVQAGMVLKWTASLA
ncbi:ketoacyl-ACP synthase III [Paenibacillus senegalensis]|uniref:ketoacyl-ACP synthase III n=1 Tax=Paenibacillus senegalensis TaxID=1465766 RepID=UPI0002886293|nr:ketoacyl-ACP synthase III [Paenibacillus senegalensis]